LLVALGRREEALTAINEALTAYHELARARNTGQIELGLTRPAFARE